MTTSPAEAGDATDRPLRPLIAGLGLVLLATALTARALTTGGGFELLHPGAQLLLDAVLLCGASSTLLARGLGRVGPSAPRAVLALSGVLALVLVLAAVRAPHQDLAWRTALSWVGLLLLALVAHDLGREPAAGRALTGLALGLVTCAAGLALEERFVARPAALARYEAGELESELGPMDASYRQALEERVHSPEAAGPFLLPGLLASATAMLLPLAIASAWHLRRGLLGAGLAACVLVLLGGFLQAQSKGGAVALLAAVGGLALLHPLLAPFRPRLLLGGAIGGGLLLVLGLAAWARNPDAEGVGLSFAVRLEYWSAGLGMARDHPLLGVGLNQFREFYAAYKPPRAEETLHAHNALVQVLAETGVVGLAAALGLLGAWARAGLSGLDALGTEVGPAAERRKTPWVLGGAALGLLLVGSYGDVYSFDRDTQPHLLALFVVLPGVTVLGAAAAERMPPRLLAAALLGGSCAFLADGLLDFGLHHAGMATLAALLVGLGTGMGRPATLPDGGSAETVGRGQAASLGLGAAAGTLALGLLLVLVPRALDADVAREAGNQAYLAASTAADPRGHVHEAAVQLDAATARYPWHARTWLERAAAEVALGRVEAAIECARETTRRAPRWASGWSELGDLLRARGDLGGAVAAHEEAVRLHPHDPAHLLALGLARAEVASGAIGATGGGTGAIDTAGAAGRAAETLEAALAADERVRQVSKKLTAAQLVALGRAVAPLARSEQARGAAREALVRAVAFDDAARADRERAERSGRRPRPDPRRTLAPDERAAAERLLTGAGQ